MDYARTTIRIKPNLLKEAKIMAAKEGTSLQEVFNRAIEKLVIITKTKPKAQKQKFTWKTVDLGADLDVITRDDIYGDPKLPE